MVQVITFQAHSIFDSFKKCLCVFRELWVFLKDFLNFSFHERAEKKEYLLFIPVWETDE